MRRAILTPGLLVGVLVGTHVAAAQKVGDKVVVIHDNVEVKVRNDVVDKVGRGMPFVVREVQGAWVEISNGTPGFIEKRHVIPFNQAMGYWSGVIRSNAKDNGAFWARAAAWRDLQEPDKAIADYNEAIRLDPNNGNSYSNRAWLWATCPDARVRDGEKAVESATRSCELDEWKNPIILDTLAAAFAEAGDFDAAVNWQTKATDMAPESDQADFRSRLVLCQQRMPYRE